MHIRPATTNDYTKIYQLMLDNDMIDNMLDHDHFLSLMDWIYLKSPEATKKHYQLVIEDSEGNLVGHYGMTPLPYSCGVKEYCFAGLGSWLVIDNKYRDGLLFLRLQSYYLKNYFKNKIDFTFGLVNRPNVLPIHEKTGYKRFAQLGIFARPYIFSNIIKKYTSNNFILLLANLISFILSPIFKLSFSPPYITRNRIVEKQTTFPDEIQDIIEPFLRNFLIRAERTKESLSWRFLQHPFHTYSIFCVYQTNKKTHSKALNGYCVTLIKELKGLKTLSIVDIILKPNDWPGFFTLWKSIHQEAIEKSVDLVAITFNPECHLRKMFQMVGFVNTHDHFTIMAHFNNKDFEKKFHHKKWYATWFDHDYM